MSLVLERWVSRIGSLCDATPLFSATALSTGRTVMAPYWLKVSAFAGIALWRRLGVVVAVGELNALYLLRLADRLRIHLRDFRIGVVLLILLLPISRSTCFRTRCSGSTSLNPVNLLLVGTLFSFLLHGLFDAACSLPCHAACSGCISSRSSSPAYWALACGRDPTPLPSSSRPLVDFDNVTGYFRDLVVKPLVMCIRTVVGAAVSRSEKPEKVPVPTLISMWIWSR